MDSGEILQLTKVCFDFGSVPILQDVELQLGEGELVAVLGSSGSGKTSLLRCIAGFANPTSGRITVTGRCFAEDGRELVPAEKRGIGMMFQDYALFPHMSVRQNVAFGLGADPSNSRVSEMLALVELADLAERYPSALSGGQQQRVALARALAPAPELILLDEPFANLDAGLREGLGRELRAVLQRTATSALLVTHDHRQALALADRVALLGPGEEGAGHTLLQCGPPREVYLRPVSREAAWLTGPAQLLAGEARGLVASTALGEVELQLEQRGPVQLVVRPEQLRFDAATAGEARVTAVRFEGGRCRLEVEQAARPWSLSASLREAPGVGIRGRLVVDSACSVVP